MLNELKEWRYKHQKKTCGHFLQEYLITSEKLLKIFDAISFFFIYHLRKIASAVHNFPPMPPAARSKVFCVHQLHNV